MSGPAKIGSMIYVNNVERMSSFYTSICGLAVVHSTPEMAILSGNGAQVIIHKSPVGQTVSKPPSERYAALKLFFTIEDIESVKIEIIELGGSIKPKKWEGPTFYVSNAVDPEGNVFHIRWAKL